MVCLCGDPMCLSCGPAQGYNPAGEAVLDGLTALARPEGCDEQAGVHKLALALARFPRLAQLLEIVARHMPDEALDAERERAINASLDAVRPCPKHGCWPDAEVDCPTCYAEDMAETERLAAEYWKAEGR